RLRQSARAQVLERTYGRDAVLDALRREAASLRAHLQVATEDAAEAEAEAVDVDQISDRLIGAAEARLTQTLRSRLQPVINATGVIIHTNLGRAPLCESALTHMIAIGAGYATLEYDLAHGARGRRDLHAEPLLCQLTSAEAAIVVNN